MPDKLPGYILPTFLSVFTVGVNNVFAKNFNSALSFIKQSEGLFLNAYKDSGGVWTIGYGSTFNFDLVRAVQPGDTIDLATAQKWLEMEVATNTKDIKAALKVSVNNNQLNALISLAYNIGINAFRKSTLLSYLNSGKSKTIVADQFLRWSYDNGVFVQGLYNRRVKEKALFLK